MYNVKKLEHLVIINESAYMSIKNVGVNILKLTSKWGVVTQREVTSAKLHFWLLRSIQRIFIFQYFCPVFKDFKF